MTCANSITTSTTIAKLLRHSASCDFDLADRDFISLVLGK